MQQAVPADSTAHSPVSGGKTRDISTHRRRFLRDVAALAIVPTLAAAIPLPVKNEHQLRRTPVEAAVQALVAHHARFPDEEALGRSGFRQAEATWLDQQSTLERALVTAPARSIEDVILKLKFSNSDEYTESGPAGIAAVVAQLEALA